MKQISSWIALMTVLFWGMLGGTIVWRSLSPEAAGAITGLLLPPLVLISFVLGLFWLLRIRARRKRVPETLEEIRNKSRQRMAGEPMEMGRVVLHSGAGRRETPCGEQESVNGKGRSPQPELQECQQDHWESPARQ